MQATDAEVKELRDLILGMDKKIDIFIARADERFNSIDTQLTDVKAQLKSQDARIWTLMVSSVIALLGLLAKLAFFPEIKV